MAADIIPALLVRTKRELETGLEHLRSVSSWVQIDFVNKNFLEGEESFPLWDEFNFEADLMLPHPKGEIDAMVALGASRVVVHARSDGAREALELLQPYRTGDFAVEAGIALRSHDTAEALGAFEGLFDYVQVMGIDREGVQGEPPDLHHKDIELIRALRAAHPNLVIQVDGAAAMRVRELVAAGASRLVIGSAIVNARDPKAAYQEFARQT